MGRLPRTFSDLYIPPVKNPWRQVDLCHYYRDNVSDLYGAGLMTDPLRASVAELVERGRMPTTEQADAQPLQADRWAALVGQVFREGAVTQAEAAALANLFPADDSDCYGVAWTLVHVVEATPGWPLPEALDRVEGPWGRLLKERVGVTQGD